jgi:hypothetical protein
MLVWTGGGRGRCQYQIPLAAAQLGRRSGALVALGGAQPSGDAESFSEKSANVELLIKRLER